MRLVHSAASIGAPAPGVTRAVVMTMGALHEGHLALVRAAREAADEVVVTIFVNPLQFNDAADLDRYPRSLEEDCALLSVEHVDVVFAPSTHEVYPGGEPLVTVSAGAIGEVFEGAHRPGHLDGVLTVVLKLMHLTRPHLAFYGAKDAQQLIAIRAMVRDLNVPVEIVGVPTVRAVDGLALSSRNAFLTHAERADALALSQALRRADAVARSGGTVAQALAAASEVFAHVPEVVVDYVAALDPQSAQAVPADYRGDALVAVAARVGQTRLIDNVATVFGGES